MISAAPTIVCKACFLYSNDPIQPEWFILVDPIYLKVLDVTQDKLNLSGPEPLFSTSAYVPIWN
jgi:hypothetical protein